MSFLLVMAVLVVWQSFRGCANMTSIPRFKSRYALCFSAARSVVHLQHRRRGDVAARLGLRTRRGLRRRQDFRASWAVSGAVLGRCFPQAPPLGSRAEGGGLDGEIAQRQRTSILCHAGFVVTPAQTFPSPVSVGKSPFPPNGIGSE